MSWLANPDRRMARLEAGVLVGLAVWVFVTGVPLTRRWHQLSARPWGLLVLGGIYGLAEAHLWHDPGRARYFAPCGIPAPSLPGRLAEAATGPYGARSGRDRGSG